MYYVPSRPSLLLPISTTHHYTGWFSHFRQLQLTSFQLSLQIFQSHLVRVHGRVCIFLWLHFKLPRWPSIGICWYTSMLKYTGPTIRICIISCTYLCIPMANWFHHLASSTELFCVIRYTYTYLPCLV